MSSNMEVYVPMLKKQKNDSGLLAGFFEPRSIDDEVLFLRQKTMTLTYPTLRVKELLMRLPRLHHDMPILQVLDSRGKKGAGGLSHVDLVHERSTGLDFGRFFCKGIEETKGGERIPCQGAQGMSRDIRQCLFAGLYADVDIINCAPTIILGVLKMHGCPCPQLEKYVLDREACFDAIRVQMPFLSKATLKSYFLITLHGGKYDRHAVASHPPIPMLVALQKEIKDAYTFLPSVNSDAIRRVYEVAKTRSNAKGAFFSLLFQYYEGIILAAAIRFMEAEGVGVSADMFDGFFVREPFDKSLLERFEKENKWCKQFKLRFSVKQFPIMDSLDGFLNEIFKQVAWPPHPSEKRHIVIYAQEVLGALHPTQDLFTRLSDELKQLKAEGYAIGFFTTLSHTDVLVQRFLQRYQDKIGFKFDLVCDKRHCLKQTKRTQVKEGVFTYETKQLKNLDGLINGTLVDVSRDAVLLKFANLVCKGKFDKHKGALMGRSDSITLLRSNSNSLSLSQDVEQSIEFFQPTPPLSQEALEDNAGIRPEWRQVDEEEGAGIWQGRPHIKYEVDTVSESVAPLATAFAEYKCVAIQAGMRMMKSTRCREYIKAKMLDNPDFRCLFVCSRVTLALSIMNSLRDDGLDFEYYSQNEDKLWYTCPRLVVQYESLHLLQPGTHVQPAFDLVVFDEIRSVLNNTASFLTNKDNIEVNWGICSALAAQSAELLVMDADLSVDAGCRFFLEEVCNGEKILVRVYTKSNLNRRIYISHNEVMWRETLFDCIARGEKVAICSHLKNDGADNVMQDLLKHNPSLRIKAYTRDTNRETIRSDFGGSGVNEALKDVDVVILTSTVTVGVDCILPFGHIFLHCAYGQGCTAREMLQMMGRFRETLSQDVYVFMQSDAMAPRKQACYSQEMAKLARNQRRLHSSAFFQQLTLGKDENARRLVSHAPQLICKLLALCNAEKSQNFGYALIRLCQEKGFEVAFENAKKARAEELATSKKENKADAEEYLVACYEKAEVVINHDINKFIQLLKDVQKRADAVDASKEDKDQKQFLTLLNYYIIPDGVRQQYRREDGFADEEVKQTEAAAAKPVLSISCEQALKLFPLKNPLSTSIDLLSFGTKLGDASRAAADSLKIHCGNWVDINPADTQKNRTFSALCVLLALLSKRSTDTPLGELALLNSITFDSRLLVEQAPAFAALFDAKGPLSNCHATPSQVSEAKKAKAFTSYSKEHQDAIILALSIAKALSKVGRTTSGRGNAQGLLDENQVRYKPYIIRWTVADTPYFLKRYNKHVLMAPIEETMTQVDGRSILVPIRPAGRKPSRLIDMLLSPPTLKKRKT